MFPLKVTEAAHEAARLAIEEHGTENSFIRVAIQGGGCAGLQYKLDLETEQRDDDYVLEENDVKFVVDGFSAVHLQDTTLDYVTSLIGSGFQFVNPNAKRKCGCGSSFGV